MEFDSVHSCIERKIRKQAIYVPQMYVDMISAACRKNPIQGRVCGRHVLKEI